MTRTFKLAAATAAAALLSLSVPALASPSFTVSKQNSNVHGTNGAVTMTITGPAVLNGGISASTGAFALHSDATEGPVIGDFIAWCLDVGHSLDLPSLYSVTTAPFTGNDISAVVNTLTQLANTAYTTVQAKLGGAESAKYSAAFQLALWEIVNENTSVYSYDVYGGDFKASGNADTLALANTFLTGLGGTVTGNYKLTYLQSGSSTQGFLPGQDSQNLVTISEVPLPAAGLLLIGALGGLGMFARRRKAAA